MAKPMKTLELRNPMIQFFLIILVKENNNNNKNKSMVSMAVTY